MKLAIIDLDGVIADADARFAKAEEVKLASTLPYKEVTNLYWRTVFDPANVPMDTLIADVHENLDRLQADGYRIVLLASRPESMRHATVKWMAGLAIVDRSLHPFRLIMKPSAFQYTKTVVWKAGIVQMLAAMFEATEVLVIDDEKAIQMR